MSDDNNQNQGTNAQGRPTPPLDSSGTSTPNPLQNTFDQPSPPPSSQSSALPNTPVNNPQDSQQNTFEEKDNENGVSENKSSDPSGVIKAPHAPKKYGGKKVIATIFGIFFLLGAVATGAYLVRNQQLSISRAWDCTRYVFEVSREGVVSVRNDSSRYEPSQKADVFINGSLITTFDVSALNPGDSATLGNVSVPSAQGFSWRVDGSKDCESDGRYDAQTTPTPQESPTPTDGPTNTPTGSPTSTPPNTPTPTLPPQISAECSQVKAYNTSWELLSQDQLNQLEAGNLVRFTVSGSATEGTFDKAMFTINGTQRNSVTAKKPGSEEYFDEYEIPTGTTSFSVDAQIHHSSLGWF